MQTLEIAVYEAKDPEGFIDGQARLHEQVGAVFDGYVTSLGLRSTVEDGVFADLVLWADETAAVAAAESLPATEELAWLHGELGEVRFFGHLPAPEAAAETLAALGAAPVVELVVVRPIEVDAFVDAHRILHDRHLEAAEPVVAHLRLAPNGDGLVGDVNGWRNGAAMEAMAPAMAARPELAPVFDERNEMVVFHSFSTNVRP